MLREMQVQVGFEFGMGWNCSGKVAYSANRIQGLRIWLSFQSFRVSVCKVRKGKFVLVQADRTGRGLVMLSLSWVEKGRKGEKVFAERAQVLSRYD